MALASACLGGDDETPTPAAPPSDTATATATSTATPGETATATDEPTDQPTDEPSDEPTQTPTATATHLPRVTPATGERVTALLLGLDRRVNEEPHGPNRTDVFQLVTYDPATGQAAVVGFPRDLWVPIPGVGNNRINTAYVWGNSSTGNYINGLELAKQTVESNFRVKIDFVIAVDFQTFIDVIDDLGGIQLDIPAELDGYNLSAPVVGHNVRIRAGRQVGTGEYVLAYSRARPGAEGDLGRLKRASQTLASIFDKARSLPAGEAAAIFLKHLPNVETTLDPADWPRLMQLASGVDLTKVQFYSVGNFVTPFTTEDGAAVLQPNYGAIDAMLDEAFPGARTE